MDEDNRIAVIGDYDSIYGFASLGLSTFPVDGYEEAEKTLKTLVGSGYGIIYNRGAGCEKSEGDKQI